MTDNKSELVSGGDIPMSQANFKQLQKQIHQDAAWSITGNVLLMLIGVGIFFFTPNILSLLPHHQTLPGVVHLLPWAGIPIAVIPIFKLGPAMQKFVITR